MRACGTVVTATILYDPPSGTVGKLIAKMLQREPAIQARRDLRRFKQFMENGEIATTAMNNDRDCIIKVTSTAICGSDLHLYDG